MAGSLGPKSKPTKTSHVRADNGRRVLLRAYITWEALGRHAGPGNGAWGPAKLWLLVHVNLDPVNYVLALLRAYPPGGRRWITWVGVPGPQPPVGPHKAAASAIWKLRPHTQLSPA
mgnify:CR=1 FL=1